MQTKQKLTIEIEIASNQADFIRCEQLSELFRLLLSNLSWLADRRFNFKCATKIEPVHHYVELPPLKQTDCN